MPGPHGPGMANAVLTGVLRSGKTLTYAPTELDRELLAVCDAAIHARVPLVLVLPFAAPDTAVTLAAAAVVSAIANRRDLDVSVAVAARNLASATSYDQFFLREEQLAKFVSRARITPGGDVSVLRRGQDAAGRLYVAPNIERLTPVLAELDALIIDSSADQNFLASQLSTILGPAGAHAGAQPAGTVLGPVVVYLTRSPLDPNIEALRSHSAIVWGWDSGSAGRLANPASATSGTTARGSAGPVTVSTAVLTDAGTAEIRISAPAPAEAPHKRGGDAGVGFDTALTELWRSIVGLASAYGPVAGGGAGATSGLERKASGSAMRWLWSMFHVVATLPVPADRYDDHASANPYMPAARLADVGRVAREFARSTTGDRREGWYRVADAFEDVLREDTGKFPPLVAWVNDVITGGEIGALAVRDRASVAAVTEALSSSPAVPDGWEEHVRVVRVADLPSLTSDREWRRTELDTTGLEHHVDLCLTGTLPKTAAGLLSAPPCRALTVIVSGPQEASRVYRAATQARQQMGEIRWESVEVSSVLLDVDPGADYVRTDPGAGLELSEHAGDVPDGDDSSPWEPFSDDVGQLIFELLTDVSSAVEAPPAPVRFNDDEPEAQVDAVVVRLRGPSGHTLWMALAPNDLVTRRRHDRLERAAGKSLTVDDDLLLVDQQARRDLLSSVLEKLAESMAYSTLMMLIGLWHERAALVRGGAMTYGDILHRMDGTAITSDTTVGSWVRADVDGPLDKKDVERFAKAVCDHRLAGEAERVGWALTTLHRVHRKASAWLTAQLDEATLASTDATVDAALNIHVSDLLEAVTSWTVEKVEPSRSGVDVAILGLLLTQGDRDALRLAADPGER